MPSKYKLFDRSRLSLKPLEHRVSDLSINNVLPLTPRKKIAPEFLEIGFKIFKARSKESPSSVTFMFGAHVIRSGTQKYLIDMINAGHISCLATNGASVIHDFEFAYAGSTTESVARYISEGQFGLWKETGCINDIVKDGARDGLGLGEAVGKAILERDMPHADISVFAAAYKAGIPITVHVGIGYDIVHEHPNCDGAAYGQTSYRDFLIFAKVMESMEGGVVMNFGSAVMAPEVFLKGLAMARNLAPTENRKIGNFTTLVCDLKPLPARPQFEPLKDDENYYFRPWKTMLVRTVADGGRSYYVQGRHEDTIPQLWTALNMDEKKMNME